MGQAGSRQPRFLREPLLKKQKTKDEPFCTADGVCCCLICSNFLWIVAVGILYLFSRTLFDLRDSNAATVWLLKQMSINPNELDVHSLDDPWWVTRPVTNMTKPVNNTAALLWVLKQLGKNEYVEEHPLNDPWWLSHPVTNVTNPVNNTAALMWILKQLGEGENLKERLLDDPWWTNRPPGPLDLPFGPSYPIAPALEWILLKMGQEEPLRRYNVSDPWWSHRPQTNITLNATNVTVTPLPSAYVSNTSSAQRRLSSSDGQPTRLFVDGKVRVSEYVEYFSVPKAGFVKLIVAPESLRYLLKVMGMTERPWWDDEYWLMRNNASDLNISNTLNLKRANVAALTVMELVSEGDVVIQGSLNTFGTVDFWPGHMASSTSSNRRLFMDDHTTQTCRRCAAVAGTNCMTQCVPHVHILGGVLGFNNHTCSC